MTEVSVIIPVYQAENYIRTCVQSVLCQTYKNIEIILVDDGSKDHSLQICEELCRMDQRIRVIHQENKGVSSARNRGINEASGEYVLFVDSDDLIAPQMIEDMLQRAVISQVDIVICGFDYVYKDRVETRIPKLSEAAYSQENIYSNFWKLYKEDVLHNIGTKLYSKQLLDKNSIRFNEKQTVLEDIQFCLDAIKAANNIYICAGNFYKYNLQANQYSIQKTYRRDYYQNLQSLFQFIANLGVKKDKDFYLIYMDSILLTLLNELYRSKTNVIAVMKEYNTICRLDYVKESVKYIPRKDVRYVKYLIYKKIWHRRVCGLLILVYLWYIERAIFE